MKSYLILEDGTKLEGVSFGANTPGSISGEIIYSTNMTGFAESLTCESHKDKLLVQTFPIVGNVGVNDDNNACDIHAKALIVREYCDEPSNFRTSGTLGDFMAKRGIVGIQGIDTRQLTHILRENGGSIKGTITVE